MMSHLVAKGLNYGCKCVAGGCINVQGVDLDYTCDVPLSYVMVAQGCTSLLKIYTDVYTKVARAMSVPCGCRKV